MMLASEHRMSKRRVMAKAKVYGFSPWVDQVDAINQIMKDTGERKRVGLLRKLVDEALDARRKKSRSAPLTEKPDNAGVRLETVESVSLLPENNKRVRYLLDDEEQRLLSVLTGLRGHLLPLVIVAIGTGMRRGDLFNLTWEKVDFHRGLIYVPNFEDGRDYSVPMNEDVRNTLRQIRSTIRGNGYVSSILILLSLIPT